MSYLSLPCESTRALRNGLSVILWLTIVGLPATAAYAQTELTISPTVTAFHYRETDDSQGRNLLKESGPLWGLKGTLKSQITSAWYLTATAHFRAGDADYEGETQSGKPLSTETAEKLASFSLQSSYYFPVRGWEIGPLIGIEADYWERDIKPTAGTSRLVEDYRWLLWRAGLDLVSPASENGQWQFTTALNRTFSNKVTVNLDELGYGRPTLEPGERWGYEVAASWTLPGDYSNLTLSLEWMRYRFGRSESVRIDGGPAGLSVTEPESRTDLWTLSAGYRF